MATYQDWDWRLAEFFKGIGAILVGGCAIFSGHCTLAQNITLDGTLGPARTLRGPNYTIPQGVGQTVGSNLFHSFGRFSLDRGEAVRFQSAANIRNILSRVTGGSPSVINGLIFTQSSNVNLFLINPSGIQLGPNARLDVGSATRGSFIATTVDALVWPNGAQFSATNPGGANSLLTIVGDPSGFLSTLQRPAPIVSSGNRLSVYEGQSLILLGGNVSLDNSILFVEYEKGGRIELGGIAAPGTVGLKIDGNLLSLSFPNEVARADVSLRNRTVLDVAASNGGSIRISTRNLEVLDGSQILAGIGAGLGNVNSEAGDILINATGAITVSELSRINNRVFGIGKGGDIEITTNSLAVTDGAEVSASTRGRGDAGNVRIHATDTVFFGGVGSNGLSSVAGTQVGSGGEGKGGDIEITTNSLVVIDGAQLLTGTRGRGDAGNVRIRATDSVSFAGVGNYEFVSGAFSAVEQGAQGKGGDIEIITNSLSVTDGAQLVASTSGQGDAGNVKIRASDKVSFARVSNGFPSLAFSAVEQGAQGKGGDIEITTNSLSVTDGAQIIASTLGRGDAGNVKIKASEKVSFAGVGSTGVSTVAGSQVGLEAEGKGGDIEITTNSLSVTDGAQLLASTLGRGDAGNVRIRASDKVSFTGVGSNGVPSGAFSSVAPGAQGKGSDVEITTNLLSLTDALISSRSQGTGRAGGIMIETRQNLELDRSNITATTQADDGGNIRLRVGDLLLMRNDSNISTTAGQAGAGGNGGNININAGFVVAVPKEDSDITANAFNGRGGNINITTQGIYGLTFRERDIPASSDITASSQFGLDGEFQLDLLTNVDPSRGLAQLPTNVVDASQQIDRRCTSAGADKKSSFVITGRGGLPSSPNDVLHNEQVITSNWVTLDSQEDSTNPVPPQTNPINTAPNQLVEAQSWVYGPNGEVILTAEAPTATPVSPWQTAPSCDAVGR